MVISIRKKTFAWEAFQTKKTLVLSLSFVQKKIPNQKRILILTHTSSVSTNSALACKKRQLTTAACVGWSVASAASCYWGSNEGKGEEIGLFIQFRNVEPTRVGCFAKDDGCFPAFVFLTRRDFNEICCTWTNLCFHLLMLHTKNVNSSCQNQFRLDVISSLRGKEKYFSCVLKIRMSKRHS